MEFCFRSTGRNLDYIRKTSDGKAVLIANIQVLDNYDNSLYTIPEGYTETFLKDYQ